MVAEYGRGVELSGRVETGRIRVASVFEQNVLRHGLGPAEAFENAVGTHVWQRS